MEFGLGHREALGVVAVDDEDDALRVRVVVAPERPYFILPANVPHRQRQIAVLDGLDVKPDGRDRRHDLAQFELVEDGRLARGVEADHAQSGIELRPAVEPHEGEERAHDSWAPVSTLARTPAPAFQPGGFVITRVLRGLHGSPRRRRCGCGSAGDG